MKKLFASESVSAGHPDKVADQISDAILDAYLAQDPRAKVGCEVLCTTDRVIIAGEVCSSATVNHEEVARRTIAEIGYNDPNLGFDAATCTVTDLVHEQSADIRQGVEQSEQGAGDQGMMFGYACNETKSLMPASIALSNALMEELDAIRREGELMLYLRPDAKCQVTIEAGDAFEPATVHTIVLSTQHDEGVEPDQILDDVMEHLIPRVRQRDSELDSLFRMEDYELLINPTGRFVIGGPNGDTGLTGRKIIVDTYGGHAAHGGGAFSGKDASKVDRSAAYMARYIAKNLVAAGVANRIQVQLAYAIGVSEPVSVAVSTFATNDMEFERIDLAALVCQIFDMRPAAIIEKFQLYRPIYSQTAVYGHFGREPYAEFFPWERTDMVEIIYQYLGRKSRCQRS